MMTLSTDTSLVRNLTEIQEMLGKGELKAQVIHLAATTQHQRLCFSQLNTYLSLSKQRKCLAS